MEEGSKALKQRKEQFYNNFATVLQENDLMRRETNGTVLQEKYLMKLIIKLKKRSKVF